MPERSPWLRLYGCLAPALWAAAPALARFSPKLREGMAGRRGLQRRLLAAADRLQGCAWFHASSVGEYEQARPVVAALRGRPGAPPVAVTHFSPSGHGYARRRPEADLHDYLPLDRPGRMRQVLRAWRPRLLVFVKFDVWPGLVTAAAEAGVPVLLLAGTLQPRSARLHPVTRPFFRDLFDRFAHLGVCTEADRARFVEDLGVHVPVTVTGDTRAEQVIRRYEQAAGGEVAARLGDLGGRLLVLGSTWPPDERLWLPVLPDLLAEHPDLRVVLVPHEPSPERLSALEGQLAGRGLASRRLSALDRPVAGDFRCILVDAVGVLAEIYRAGTVAYVGGSFTTGVHNTMEPAVAGLPVLFGPVIQNAVEAGSLVERGAGFVVRRPVEAASRLRVLLADPDDLARRGAVARQLVLAQRGAVEKSLALLLPFL